MQQAQRSGAEGSPDQDRNSPVSGGTPAGAPHLTRAVDRRGPAASSWGSTSCSMGTISARFDWPTTCLPTIRNTPEHSVMRQRVNLWERTLIFFANPAPSKLKVGGSSPPGVASLNIGWPRRNAVSRRLNARSASSRWNVATRKSSMPPTGRTHLTCSPSRWTHRFAASAWRTAPPIRTD